MYGNNLVGAAQCEKQMTVGGTYVSPTVGEALDQRILVLKAEMDRLIDLRTKLRDGASLLDLNVQDMRQLSNF